MRRRSPPLASALTESCKTWPVPQLSQIQVARAIPSLSGVPGKILTLPQTWHATISILNPSPLDKLDKPA